MCILQFEIYTCAMKTKSLSQKMLRREQLKKIPCARGGGRCGLSLKDVLCRFFAKKRGFKFSNDESPFRKINC